jgi:hypothetical protein
VCGHNSCVAARLSVIGTELCTDDGNFWSEKRAGVS